ncbi:hypothetical protein HUJ05_004964 [Dendroctonus ponderosae]|nr:hypothetical protein HUJ05_004964 [Dendroctonus ponderosae]
MRRKSRGLWKFLPDVSSTTAVDIIKGDEAVGEVISRAFRLRLASSPLIMSTAVVDETSGRNFHRPRLQSAEHIPKCDLTGRESLHSLITTKRNAIGMTPDFDMQVKEEITIEEQDLSALVKIEDEATCDLSSCETTSEQAANAAQINQHSLN